LEEILKIVRWAAVAVVVLMSLMNLGSGGSSDLPAAAVELAVILGVLGLVAAFGLARRLSWGIPAALAVGAVNLALAVVALVAGWEGGAIGIGVNVVGLVLIFFARPQAEVSVR
jgi:uncharacterized membrane protein (DUF2068 family)